VKSRVHPEAQYTLTAMILQTPTAEPAQIAAAVGTLPPLWNTKPELWFAIAEAKFNLAGITQEKTKYHHVLTVLSPLFPLCLLLWIISID
jgi:hypothetical protein